MIPPNSGDSTSFLGGAATATLEPARGPHAGNSLVPSGGPATLPLDPMSEWGDAPAGYGGERPAAGIDPFDFLHAFRRRWPIALGIALLTALTLIAVLYFLLPEEKRAEALLLVKPTLPTFMERSQQSVPESDVQRFQATQLGRAKSLMVIKATLAKPEINGLATLRSEKDGGDKFIRDEVLVSFINRSDLMSFSLKTRNGEDAKKIVKAMYMAYISEVVQKENDERQRSHTKLQTEVKAKSDALEEARKNYKALVASLGAIDPDQVKVKLDMDIRALDGLRYRMMQAETDAKNAEAEFVSTQSRIKEMEGAGRDPNSIGFIMKENRAYDELLMDMRKVQTAIDNSKLTVGYVDPELENQARLLANQKKVMEREGQKQYAATARSIITQGQLNERRVKAQLKVQDAKNARAEYEKLATQLENTTQQADQLIASKERIARLQQQVSEMQSTLFKWDLELQAPNRVELVQDAEVPQDTDIARWMLILGAGFLGFCATTLGVTVWEFAKRRVNTVHDVTNRLRLGVVGTLPRLTGQGFIGRMSPVDLEAALTDSVDSLRTALIHGVGSGRPGAVMVTSAGDMEGKTTVASQLAVSLARCGRRTLLIDGDLRSPSLHQLFEMGLDRGLSEVLRGEIEVEDAIRATPAAGLKFLSAGQFSYASIQALENDNVGRLFDRLKGQFDFIVVDAAPVLAFADSLLIGQHVDGAILSVRLDLSQRHKIDEAVNRLKTVGVLLLGAVVNGAKPQTSHRGGEQPAAA